MKKHFAYLLLLLAAINVCSCSDNTELPPEEPLERVVIVYMMAENSLSGVTETDLLEMQNATANIPTNCKIVVYRDNADLPCIYTFSQKDGKQTWQMRTQDEDSTDSLNMLRTMNDIIKAFPAKHYALTLWSHGKGWMPKKRTIGIDNNQNTTNNRGTEMNITALRWVLEQLPTKMDYVFFDACFMQGIEVAYELKDVTDWTIGSPAEIPGPGAPYDIIVPYLCKADVEGIVRGYNEGYPCRVDRIDYPGALISAARSEALDQLAAKTKAYLPTYTAAKTELDFTNFQYHSMSYSIYTYSFDMNTAMYNTLTAEEYADWRQAFDQAVPYRSVPATGTWYADFFDFNHYPTIQDLEHYGGISMYTPSRVYVFTDWNTAFHTTAWYTAAGWDSTGW